MAVWLIKQHKIEVRKKKRKENTSITLIWQQQHTLNRSVENTFIRNFKKSS